MTNKIFIGDNLNALKTMISQKTLVDFIYIDPPYNTNSKFSYNDSHEHDEWILFMRKRLTLAVELMHEKSSIFISIDDNKLFELKILCDEIFGKKNFIANLVTKQAQRSNSKLVNVVHEYILVYGKNKKKIQDYKIKRMKMPFTKKIIKRMNNVYNPLFSLSENNRLLREEIKLITQEKGITWHRNYNNFDKKGRIFFAKDLSTPGKPRVVQIEEINLHLEKLETRGWSSDAKFIDLFYADRLHFKAGRPYEIYYLDESYDNISSILDFYSRQGTEDMRKLGLQGFFDTPKPVELIKYLIRMSLHEKDGVILDFFAGSGTTAQAVYELNEEDEATYKYILVQLNEEISESSPVYSKLAEIGLKTSIDQILFLRLNTFIEKKGLKKDYEIIY